MIIRQTIDVDDNRCSGRTVFLMFPKTPQLHAALC